MAITKSTIRYVSYSIPTRMNLRPPSPVGLALVDRFVGRQNIERSKELVQCPLYHPLSSTELKHLLSDNNNMQMLYPQELANQNLLSASHAVCCSELYHTVWNTGAQGRRGTQAQGHRGTGAQGQRGTAATLTPHNTILHYIGMSFNSRRYSIVLYCIVLVCTVQYCT